MADNRESRIKELADAVCDKYLIYADIYCDDEEL